MSTPTILFLADPHLGDDKPGHQASLEEVLTRAHRIGPSLVVILGDVTQDGKVRQSYFDYARAQSRRVGVDIMRQVVEVAGA